MTVTRRQLLLGGAGAGGLLAAAGLLRGDQSVRAAATLAAPADPRPAALLDADPVAHLVRRVAPAPSAALVAEVTAVGPDAWVAAQLAPDAAPAEGRLGEALGQLAQETMEPAAYVEAQRAAREARQAVDQRTDHRAIVPRLRPPAAELALSLLLRRTGGDDHLRESMVEVWGDLLHVHIGHDGLTQLLTPFLVRDVLRPLALGAFDDLLVGVTTSPAMLAYLDGARSRAGAVNENHARELLELHTVGVEAHDEDDVAAVARVLTGWVVDPGTATSRLIPWRHDRTPQAVLGWTGTGDVGDAEDLLRHLARLPTTARRVARTLAVRFVADEPDDDLVADLAAVYLDHDTAIAPVLAALLGHAAFTSAVGTKLRRPMEFTTAALAATVPTLPAGLDGVDLRAVGEGLVALGHTPHGWPAPNGYPDVAPAWVSSAAALGRWSLATAIAAVPPVDDDPAAVVDELSRRLLLAPPAPSVRDALLQAASATRAPARTATALVLDLPAAHLR